MAQKAKTQKEDHVKELLKQAEAGIQDVFESDRYKRYLTVMSRFHSYSARNCVLILLQILTRPVLPDMRHGKRNSTGRYSGAKRESQSWATRPERSQRNGQKQWRMAASSLTRRAIRSLKR